MTYQQASQLVGDPNASSAALAEAAAVIGSTPESSYDDLVQCLRRGGHCAELAATTLYVRTKRPRADASLRSASVDAEDWVQWLMAHDLIRTRVA